MMTKPRTVLIAIIGVASTVLLSISPAMSCQTADNLNQVAGNHLCLAIYTFMPKKETKEPILRVYLHGDVSRGGAADYLSKGASRRSEGIVSVVMLRPGYYGKDGRKSTGRNYNRRDSYTKENIGAIAAAIQVLKNYHKASRVVLVGHSGGAAISAVILGRHPGIADAALLVSCPCDLVKWRRSRGWRLWTRSLNPIRYVEDIPADSVIIALAGSNDTNTPAKICRHYIKKLKNRDVSANLRKIPDAGHGFRRLGDSAIYKKSLSELNGS